MKIESSVDLGITVTICFIFACCLVLGMYGCYQSHETDREAMRQGLHQKPVPVKTIYTKVWVKEDDESNAYEQASVVEKNGSE